MTGTTQDHHDVVVVGARCAGAATALLLARQGHDVLIVDRAAFPSDTISTHGIMRGGVVQLSRWGLLDELVASGAPEIRSVTYAFGDHVIRKAVEARSGVDVLLAPRRNVLDAVLLRAAVDAGARFTSGLSVTGTTTDAKGRTTGITARDVEGRQREIGATVVVGADGVQSRVARAVAAPVIDERPSNGASHYAYVSELELDGFELFVADRAYAGLFPTHGGEAAAFVCVPGDTTLAGVPDRETALVELLHRASPALAARVRAGRITSPVRSAVRLPNHVRAAAGPGWALVGDAGYHRDPITGHGITDAFRDAELLARRLGHALSGEVDEATALAGYAEDRDQAIARIFDLTCALGALPPVPEFLTLQKEYDHALEAEAADLAARPALPALAHAR